MNAMLDLFEMPAVPGLAMADEFISAAEEATLIAHIDQTSLSPFRFQQWTGKRLTRSYGWSYDFETGVFAPTEPLPQWLDDVRRRAARFAGEIGNVFATGWARQSASLSARRTVSIVTVTAPLLCRLG